MFPVLRSIHVLASEPVAFPPLKSFPKVHTVTAICSGSDVMLFFCRISLAKQQVLHHSTLGTEASAEADDSQSTVGSETLSEPLLSPTSAAAAESP